MRPRKIIEEDIGSHMEKSPSVAMDLKLEILLDIRDLLSSLIRKVIDLSNKLPKRWP